MSSSASSTLTRRLRQIPRAASKIAIGEVIGERARSRTSASASAPVSRVRIAIWRRHQRTSRLVAELVEEILIRLQAGGRSAKNPVLKRAEPLPKRHHLIEAVQFV